MRKIIEEAISEVIICFIGILLLNIGAVILSDNLIHISIVADICIAIGILLIVPKDYKDDVDKYFKDKYEIK